MPHKLKLKQKAILWGLLMGLVPCICWAQGELDYFPIQEGNQWIFEYKFMVNYSVGSHSDSVIVDSGSLTWEITKILPHAQNPAISTIQIVQTTSISRQTGWKVSDMPYSSPIKTRDTIYKAPIETTDTLLLHHSLEDGGLTMQDDTYGAFIKRTSEETDLRDTTIQLFGGSRQGVVVDTNWRDPEGKLRYFYTHFYCLQVPDIGPVAVTRNWREGSRVSDWTDFYQTWLLKSAVIGGKSSLIYHRNTQNPGSIRESGAVIQLRQPYVSNRSGCLFFDLLGRRVQHPGVDKFPLPAGIRYYKAVSESHTASDQ